MNRLLLAELERQKYLSSRKRAMTRALSTSSSSKRLKIDPVCEHDLRPKTLEGTALAQETVLSQITPHIHAKDADKEKQTKIRPSERNTSYKETESFRKKLQRHTNSLKEQAADNIAATVRMSAVRESTPARAKTHYKQFEADRQKRQRQSMEEKAVDKTAAKARMAAIRESRTDGEKAHHKEIDASRKKRPRQSASMEETALDIIAAKASPTRTPELMVKQLTTKILMHQERKGRGSPRPRKKKP